MKRPRFRLDDDRFLTGVLYVGFGLTLLLAVAVVICRHWHMIPDSWK